MTDSGGSSMKMNEQALFEYINDKKADISLEEGWKLIMENGIDVLRAAVADNFSKSAKPFGNKGYVSLYTLSYNLSHSPFGTNEDYSEKLYTRYENAVSDYLEKDIRPSILSKTGDDILKEFAKQWGNFCIMLNWMRNMFFHLDNSHVKNQENTPTLVSCALKCFKAVVYEKTKSTVLQALFLIINRERDGESIDREVVRNCVNVLKIMGCHTKLDLKKVSEFTRMEDLSIYNDDFETPLLKETRVFYTAKSVAWLATGSTPGYLKEVEDAINREKNESATYLSKGTVPQLLKVLHEVLLQTPLKQVLEMEGSGAPALFLAFDKDNLVRLYRLYSLVPDCLHEVSLNLRNYVESEANTLYENRRSKIASLKLEKPPKKEKADDPEFTRAMISLHDRISHLVSEQFGDNKLFKNAMKDGFSNVLMKDVSTNFTNAEIVSTYADRILKGGEKLGDAAMEFELERIISVFYYLPDKDLFAEIYRNQLAKRLLNGRSASMDAEKQMISKLKQQCGAPLTSKLEGMIRDLQVGDDRRQEFDKHLKTLGVDLPIEFHLELLSSGFWPTYKVIKLNLPAELSMSVTHVDEWFKSANSHRTLNWVYSVGDTSVKRRFALDGGKAKTHDMTVTTMQAIVLLMFNSVALDDTIEYADIKQKIGENVDDLLVKPVLHSLACGKFKLLVKSPESKKIADGDKFSFNKDFKSKMNKFRVPVATIEPTHDMKRVKEDRSFAVDACIVRIMKARKQLQHNLLLSEVIRQLHYFEPQPRLVKTRIENLIEREYLERDAEEQKLYRYLA